MGPLEGVTVIDLSQVGPGARCSAALRDLGADVVKVVPPASAGRIDPPSFAYGGGRGVRSVELDLKTDEGRSAFLQLVASANVVVESYRPGVADRLGVGYEACRAANPAIVYAAITGYGQDGPYAGFAGHDLNYLAVGGFLGAQGIRADGGPALPGATIADGAGGGMHAALSIAAALFRRATTREGAYLDVSTAEGVLHLTSLAVDEYLATGVEVRPGTTVLTGKYACYDVYPCADGRWLSVAAIEARFFANLCRALGLDELAAWQYDDDRQDELRARLREAFASKGRDEWAVELAPLDTCVAPVLGVAEVADDPHFVARRAFTEDTGRGHRQVAPVLAGADRGDDS